MLVARQVPEHVLRDAQVGSAHHGQDDAVPLGVLSAVFAQVRVLVDVRVERDRLLGGGEHPAA